VNGDRPTDDDFIACSRSTRSNFHSKRHNPDARSVNENFVGLSAVDHLCVACYQCDSGGGCSLSHGQDNLPKVSRRKSLFENKSNRQIERARSAHCKVIDRPVHRQLANIAPGKKDWINDKRIRAESYASIVHGKNRAIMQRLE
jgi:hypothetical protein